MITTRFVVKCDIYYNIVSENVIRYYWRYQIMDRLRRKIDKYLIDWKN